MSSMISGPLSPFDNLNLYSNEMNNPPAAPGGLGQEQGQGQGLPGSSNPQTEIQEIQNAILAMVGEMLTLAQELEGTSASQGSMPGGGGGNNLYAASDFPGSASDLQPPPSGPAATATAPSAPAPSGTQPVGAPGAGALGPNVPTALQPYVQDINAAARQTGVPASLIGAQILQESGGNPNAVTTNPALGLPDTGLMQVDQATFQGLQQQYPDLLGGKSVSDPATNIMAGALLDGQLLKQNNNNIGSALTAYNGAADPNYVSEVTAKMNALQNGTPVPGGFN